MRSTHRAIEETWLPEPGRRRQEPERALLCAVVLQGLRDKDERFIMGAWFTYIMTLLALENYIEPVRAKFRTGKLNPHALEFCGVSHVPKPRNY